RAIEAAAETFEARMEAFGARAEAIAEDASLTEAQRETRIAALWTEYQPDLTAFTSVVTQHASAIAAQVLAEIDVEAVVAEALAGVEVSGALQAAQGMAANGAWASNDPEHMTTYGLMADYALGTAMDSIEEVQGEVEAAVDEAVAEAVETGHEGKQAESDED
ncbi:MAG TPA: hypothetical protein PLR59_05285, partial [Brevundimonas sp.]|nr:hypothetical protein [Brevundimonas sp.]